MLIVPGILTLAAASLLAPALHRALGGRTAWTGGLLALLPFALGCWFATQIPGVARGETEPIVSALLGVPELGFAFTFRLDGLSLLFALLICFIGSFVLLYAGRYMEHEEKAGRFFAFLTGFMVSMLGLVLCDNILLVFVFWELTSITSFLLIGFEHEREKARKAALQALLTTGLGGLFMLAGLVLIALEASGQLGLAAPSFEMSVINRAALTRESSGLWTLAFVLLLAGCFTKSAQFPFHYWLPNAMEGPTPVSALLHSSTMVKAGVYLLARLTPAMGGDPAWVWTLSLVGGFTMLFAAWMAARRTELKKILAYTTVSSLGVLVLCIGLAGLAPAAREGTLEGGVAEAAAGVFRLVAEAPGHAGGHAAGHGEGSAAVHAAHLAAKACVVYLFAHAFFKAALFMVAGSVTHATGEKDTERLGGLFRAMPITAIAGLVAAASMAGVPAAFGFVGKEFVLAAALEGPEATRAMTPVLAGAVFLMAVFTVVASWQVGVRPFFLRSTLAAGDRLAVEAEGGHAHEAPWGMWLGYAALTVGTVLAAWTPGLFVRPLVGAGIVSLTGSAYAGELKLGWLGLVLHPSIALGLSLLALVGGTLVFLYRGAFRRGIAWAGWFDGRGPDRWYRGVFDGMMALAKAQTRIVQHGSLPGYIRTCALTLVALAGWALVRGVAGDGELEGMLRRGLTFGGAGVLETLLLLAAVLAATFVAVLRTRLAVIVVLGVIGVATGLFFVIYGAPDVAMTQFATETLTVVIFVLVVYHLPKFANYSPRWVRGLDVLWCTAFGVVMGAFVLAAAQSFPVGRISEWHALNAYELAHGRNIVNVILVDFRALDTMGEISVLGLAAVGVLTLLKMRSLRPGRVVVEDEAFGEPLEDQDSAATGVVSGAARRGEAARGIPGRAGAARGRSGAGAGEVSR